MLNSHRFLEILLPPKMTPKTLAILFAVFALICLGLFLWGLMQPPLKLETDDLPATCKPEERFFFYDANRNPRRMFVCFEQDRWAELPMK